MQDKIRQRQRHGRTRWIICLVLVLLIVGGTANYLRPVPVVVAQAGTLSALDTGTVNVAWPSYGQAAVAAPGFGVLATHGSDVPLPIASIAKIITALAILEKKPLAAGQAGPSLTIGAQDVALFQHYAANDGSLVPVVAGEQLTEYQILQALLLPSANNIADSAAIWTFGSLEAYHTYATQMLGRYGLEHTTVGSDASGFLPDTRSTAADLVKLGDVALQQPVLEEIMAQKQAALPVAGVVHNVNSLLGSEGIIGIKTGNTDEAGGCFLYAAKYEVAPDRTVTIIMALMGAPNLGAVLADAVPFLRSVRQNFVMVKAVQAGQQLGTYTLPWNKIPVAAVSAESVSFIFWRGTPLSSRISLDKLTPGQAQNTRAGTLTVQSGTSTSTHPIILQKPIPNPPWTWRLFRNPLAF